MSGSTSRMPTSVCDVAGARQTRTPTSNQPTEIRSLRSLTCQQPSVQPCFQSEIVGLPSKTRRSRCQSARSRRQSAGSQCKSARSRWKPAGFHRCGLFLDENTLETTPDMPDSDAELPFLSAVSQKSSAASSSGSATRCAAVEKWDSRCGNDRNASENVKHRGELPIHPGGNNGVRPRLF